MAALPGDYARLHLWVRGRVQGVFFRAATADEAQALALSGWVRNLPDGRVEIVAEGRRPALQALAAWAHQGPPAARVAEVEEQWDEFKGEFRGFRVR
jgi:acylphosphatase